ncbi:MULTISPECIES: hypothetical protein [Methylobacterium]|jgi:hypothetical protein|uniref:Uncharacterized protein n=2 Tax=Methylobacterium TaxID=407 RepID=A0A2U8VT56_9HYPH|nr:MULTISPECIES: hypothetical protein [Methylobacterium]AWN36598.1 hypothetical protein DK427_13360 [Methylobacterium radiodurans]GJD55059.1 hypothetical protein IFDJLNFL_0941 [Methylobacterium dankookense]VUF12057.1 hypothetical protein MTDSW087_01745 [Methylobacterium dankookense]
MQHARKSMPVVTMTVETVRGETLSDRVRPELADAVIVVMRHAERSYALDRVGSGEVRLLCQQLLRLARMLPPSDNRREPREERS